MTAIIRHLVFLVVLICSFLFSRAQETQQSSLHLLLKQKDSILFDAAFNRCDSMTMESLFTEDFEFYHDKGGATIGREEFLAPIRKECAGHNPNAPQAAKRILTEGSLEVFPLYKDGILYGAIQHGIHSFKFLNQDKEYQQGDTAKFTHLWVLEDGQWRIKRELSYDHQYHEADNSK
ncbi:MAG: nuclear transport factor 2 family protein [Flavobacteriaceae bacterium]